MRKLAGIEINEDSITTIILAKGTKSYSIEEYKLFEYTSFDELNNCFKSIADLIPKDSFVSVSIPANDFYIRTFRVPFNSKDKISKIISFEIENQLPVDINLIKTDFKITENKTVLTFSCEEELINNQISELNKFGIKPDILTVSGLPWAEFYNSKYPTNNSLLFYFCNNRITYFFSGKNGISFVRTIYGNANVNEFQDRVITDLKLSILSLFESTGYEFIPEDVVVTGSNFSKYNLDEIFKLNYGIPVIQRDLIDDLNKIKSSEISGISSLALYEKNSNKVINLIRGKNRVVRFIEDNKKSILKSGIILSILILFSLLNSLSNLHNLNKTIGLYDSKIEKVFKRSFPKTKKIVDPIIQMRSKVRELKKKNPAINTNVKKIDILNAISKAIPDTLNVTFSKLVIGRGIISISGKTETFILVDNIKKRLETIPYFNSVVMSSPSKSGGGSKVKFRLTIKLKRQ